MVVAALYGMGIGLVGGIVAGSVMFSRGTPKSYEELHLSADFNDDIPEPDESKPVSAELRSVLDYAPMWTKWPDFERVMWINHIIKTLWPHYNKAIADIALEQAKAQLPDVIKQVAVLEAVDIEKIDLGTKPLTLAGIKTYETVDDEVILEAPVAWGSNLSVRVSVRIKLGPLSIYIPLEVENVQLKALARVTLKPLVETLPCLGAVTITLLEVPYVDFGLMLINRLDLMALPGVKDAANIALKMVLDGMLVYPHHMTFPIMENGGVAPPPQGMLMVKVLRADGLKNAEFIGKSDPYVELSVHVSKSHTTKTVKNSTTPTWNEDFTILVENPATQSLTVTIKDDDLGFGDKALGIANIPFQEADFILYPKKKVNMTVDLMAPHDPSNMPGTQGAPGTGTPKVGRGTLDHDATFPKFTTKEEAVVPTPPGPQHTKKKKNKHKPRGRLYLEVQYLPFGASGEAALEEDEVRPLTQRMVSSKITQDNKGVLTVTLTRCINLEARDGAVDAYVQLTLYDPAKEQPFEQTSSVIMNEPSPRWGQKFDFIMVSATSTLTLTVFDKSGFFRSLLTLKPWAKKKDDELGKVRIHVEDVVRNKRLKDVWALQETQQGEMALTLEWTPVKLQD